MSGSKCEERRECGEMESVKKEGDSVKKGKCDDKEEQKPYIQFLCTAPLYSIKHRVVVIRIYIILIKFTDHISFLLSKTSDQLFPYLNLLKKSGKRGICSIPKLY